MLKFYYSGAPNPTKVALFLEETGTPYDPIPIDTRKGEQHKPEFLAINPSAKLPAIGFSSTGAISHSRTVRRCLPLKFCVAPWRLIVLSLGNGLTSEIHAVDDSFRCGSR